MHVIARESVPLGYKAWARALMAACRRDVASFEARRERLREEVKTRLNVSYVFFSASGRAGLRWLLGCVPGASESAEILVPNYNFFAVSRAVIERGFRATHLDADDDFGEPSIERAKAHLTRATRGILLSHHFGHPSDMLAWEELAAAHGVSIIEDCAHGFGARVDGRSIGSFGLGGSFSLSLTKALVAGAGGIVVTQDARVAAALEARERALEPAQRLPVLAKLMAALVGKAVLDPRFYPVVIHRLNRILQPRGIDVIDELMRELPTSRSSPELVERSRLHPAFAQAALEHLPLLRDETMARRAVVERLRSLRWRHLSVPEWRQERDSTYLVLPVRCSHPERLRLHLLRNGIDTRMDYLSAMIADPIAYPRSTRLAQETLYLPVRSVRSTAEIDAMIFALDAFDTSDPA